MANSNSRLEQLIEDIYEYVDNCKTAALHSDKIIVVKDELLDLVDELRLRTPDEIKKYQRIVANRDAIINDAENKAALIIAEAEAKANKMISESEIMGQAYSQANEIVRKANEEADQISSQVKRDTDEITSGAFAYTNDLLDMAESVLENAYNDAKAQFDTMLTTLNNSLTVVKENKKEMAASAGKSGEVDDMLDDVKPVEKTFSDDDFDLDGDVFIENIDQ